MPRQPQSQRRDLQARIRQLHVEQGWSIDEVFRILQAENQPIGLRSLKKCLREWGFGRYLTAQDALAALRTFKEQGYSQQSPPPDDTQLRIRGMLVSFRRVAEHYRRKGITDALAWLERQDPVDPDHPQYGVEVPEDPEMEELDSVSHAGSHLTDFDNGPGVGVLEFEPYLDHSRVFSPANYDAAAHGANVQWEPLRPLEAPSLSRLPRSPMASHTSERLVWLALAYGSSYRSSARALTHEEPVAYGLTETGQFGHLMQDGLAALLHRGDSLQAWDYFDRALSKVPAILVKEHSPMSLAQVYTILCEMESRAREQDDVPKQAFLRAVVKMLLDNTFELDDSPGNHCCKEMFASLSRSQHKVEDCLSIMRCLVDTFDDYKMSQREQRPATSAAAPEDYWKRLFLIERYCDGLYHAHHSTPRQSLRSRLLEEQKQFYGGLARTNVLWTLSNVADDELDNRHPQRAGELFLQALHAAFRLQDGFARAKVQFAALKGLSSVAEAKARLRLWGRGLDWGRSSGRRPGCPNHVRRLALEHLNEAENWRKDAEDIATSAFGLQSRRVIVAADRRGHLERLKASVADP